LSLDVTAHQCPPAANAVTPIAPPELVELVVDEVELIVEPVVDIVEPVVDIVAPVDAEVVDVGLPVLLVVPVVAELEEPPAPLLSLLDPPQAAANSAEIPRNGIDWTRRRRIAQTSS
jgi:hypothetical protein